MKKKQPSALAAKIVTTAKHSKASGSLTKKPLSFNVNVRSPFRFAENWGVQKVTSRNAALRDWGLLGGEIGGGQNG